MARKRDNTWAELATTVAQLQEQVNELVNVELDRNLNDHPGACPDPTELQRALVMMARDASHGATRLYSVIRLQETMRQIQAAHEPKE